MWIDSPKRRFFFVNFFKLKSCQGIWSVGWIGVYATLTAKVISWRWVTHMYILAFSHQDKDNFLFQKPPTTFLTCFSRGDRPKYVGKKVRLNRVSKSQPPGHESDTLTTEPPGRGLSGY